jgi:hypothetical protein
MSSEPCPRCGKHPTVAGYIPTWRGDPEFVPDGIRWLEHFSRRLFQENPVVKLLGPARACLDCGLVWTDLDPGKLRRIIQQEGIAVGGKKEEPEI